MTTGPGEQTAGLMACLRCNELFASLSEEMLEKVAALCQVESFPAKSVIFSEGEPAHKMYLLQEGIVVIRIQVAPDARSIVVEPIDKKCSVFGWSGLAESRMYTASATCATDARIIAIDGDKLMALLEAFPAAGLVVMRRLVSIVSSRLRRTREHLTRDVHLTSYHF